MQLKEIYELLDMEIEHSETKKEWGWKKIMVRLIMYPLSLFLILVSIFFTLPAKGYFTVLVVLIIVGLYLYSDVKILMQKRRRK